jgi:hypothetical protein
MRAQSGSMRAHTQVRPYAMKSMQAMPEPAAMAEAATM